MKLPALLFPPLLALTLALFPSGSEARESDPQRATFSVADSIQLTFLAGDSEHPIQYSPDGSQWVVLSKTGDVAKNLVHFNLYLFDSEHPRPGGELIARLSSSSNRPAIHDLNWMPDNHTLTFMGEQPGEPCQAYAVDSRSKTVRRLVRYPRSLVSFSASSTLQQVAFLAYPPPSQTFSEDSRRKGVFVTDQRLLDLLLDPPRENSAAYQLGYLNRSGQPEVLPIPPQYRLDYSNRVLALAPDGKKLLLNIRPPACPANWNRYEDPWIKEEMKPSLAMPISQLFVVDLETGTFRPLLDAPFFPGGNAIWSADSQSIYLGRTYAPLDSADASELRLRQTQRLAFEVEVASAKTTLLTTGPLVPFRCDGAGGTVDLRGTGSGPITRVRKKSGVWQTDPTPPPSPALKIEVEQDLNLSPRIIATAANTSTPTVLLDLNPNIARFRLGKVEEFKAPIKSGRVMTGGLFLPPDFVEGHRYPLVIQTHGWKSGKFWPDGNYGSCTAYAAQELCTRGIVVAQMDDVATVQEGVPDKQTGVSGPDDMANVEGVIEHLSRRGLIDRERVGLMGWSASCLSVKYTLTHSSYPFAAAVVAEGIDPSYWQYLIYQDIHAWQDLCEKWNGGSPWGEGLQAWAREAPGFLLHKVRAPVLIQSCQRNSILNEWEWLAGLRRLGKPVEMVCLGDGAHNVFKPSDRLISQGLALDWFLFWLTGQQDPDPSKTEQFARWNALRRRPPAH